MDFKKGVIKGETEKCRWDLAPERTRRLEGMKMRLQWAVESSRGESVQTVCG